MDRRSFLRACAAAAFVEHLVRVPEQKPMTLLGRPVVFTEMPDAPKEIRFGSLKEFVKYHFENPPADQGILMCEEFSSAIAALMAVPEDQWNGNPDVESILNRIGEQC